MRAWGQRANLFCFFDEIDTARTFRLAVFQKQDPQKSYRSADGATAMDQVPLGTIFELSSRRTKAGYTQLVSAIPIE